ncbi:tetratricopeptide repeat protein [uncultured Psychroserpens sp.]|uniref:tetratricopeptide repeat protein n=1 Tax=uncultured Psychroserpens sp. TaxID=255436 RepID=UPI0026160F95|nr:tetratricopeptide repeat protein [uncultured Psychroserpens sp.]
MTSKMDVEKFHLLNHLWNESINNNIEDAMVYSNDMIVLGNTLKIDTIISFGFDRKAVTYSYLNEFDSSGVYFKKALNIYKKTNDFKKIAGIQRNLGQDHNMTGQIDSALYYYSESKINYTKANDTIGIADILNSEAIANLMKGYYNIAIDKAITAEKIYIKNEKNQDLNQNRMVIASIYGEMKDTVNAINYYNKTIDFFREQNQKRQLCATLFLLTNLQISNKKLYNENDQLINEMIVLSKELKDPALIDDVQTNLAKFYFTYDNYKNAEIVQRQLVKNAEERNYEYSYAFVSKDLAKSLIAQKKYSEAIIYLKKSDAIATKLELNGLKPIVNKLLSKSYEALNNHQESLKHYKVYEDLSSDIYNTESTNRFSELQTIYETEKKEAEIALQNEQIKSLNIQAKNDRLTKTLYGIGMFSFLAISSLLYFGFTQRIKKNKIEREKQEAIYKQEIEFKKKELASQTLHLVQKNTFIQELKENLEKIKKSPELFKVEFRRLVMLLKKQNAEDKDWEVFKSYFSEVHNNFDIKIKSITSDITEKEIRLASFLRMNLSTKEIASMLNVLPDSVLKSKYRLKKKLGLDKTDDLTQFLNTLN